MVGDGQVNYCVIDRRLVIWRGDTGKIIKIYFIKIINDQISDNKNNKIYFIIIIKKIAYSHVNNLLILFSHNFEFILKADNK